MRTEALIFDMDGTMIDSMPFHKASWIDFAALPGHRRLALGREAVASLSMRVTSVKLVPP
jgi:beta-phosphoglucomutase-like phosphatase (HAD superfamily)